jgi:hypothetical protein
MKHYSYDEWQQYVKNEIADRSREELENHLYTCDQCLEEYLLAVSTNESSLPTLSNESSFTDLVMEMVPDTVRTLNTMSNVPSVPDTIRTLNTMPTVYSNSMGDTEDDSGKDTQTKTRPFYQQAVFHYLLAAAATILLMFSGAFQSLLTYTSSLEKPHIQETHPSVTEGVIDKTFAWMDSLEKKEANKK